MILDGFRLTDKVAVVTGGGRGIGRAIALGLAEAGAKLAISSRTEAQLGEVKEEIEGLGCEVLAVRADVSVESEVMRLVEMTGAAFGRIDILVNAAGISPVYKRAEAITEAEWNQIISVNLTGTFMCCREVGKVMIAQKEGRIINLTSIGGKVGLPRLAAYCAAKGGVEQLTKVLALEWAQHNVRVNALAPAFVETAMTAGLRDSERLYRQILDDTPMGRLAAPEEVAGAAIFLASDHSGYVTGQTLYVDGGWTAR